MRYDADSIHEETVHDLESLVGKLSDSSVCWINVQGLQDVEALKRLGDLFDLHRLALEDVVNLHQRAKVEEYGEHLFIVLRMATQQQHLETEQLSMFLGKNFLLTLHPGDSDCLDPVRERLRQSRGRIRQVGPDYLAYAVIDTTIDAYFPIVDEYGERMERLDEELSIGHTTHFMDQLHDVRGDLMLLRRAVRPLRDALIALTPDPYSLITESTQFYIRDCFDHTIQLLDLLDTYREMCSDLRDYYMSSVNTRMNEIMKVLTIIATIFIPLSFIAGVYGMNFNTNLPGNMPELNVPYGYVGALVLMTAVALGLVYYVWRRGWLDTSEPGPGQKT